MGFWFLLFYLDAGVPVTTYLYVPEEQACLNIVAEHLESIHPDGYVEVIYANCPQGSPPRKGHG